MFIMKTKVNFYSLKRTTVKTETGFMYEKSESVLNRTEEWEGTENEIFLRFYKSNNSLKYCNGTFYEFTDREVAKRYSENFNDLHTIENYYGAGIVD